MRKRKAETDDEYKERRRIYDAHYRLVNADKISINEAGRYVENKEKSRLKSAAYYAKNHDRHLAVSSAWKAANPDSRRIHNQTRRAAKALAGGVLSIGLAQKLFNLQKGKCACCGKSLKGGYHMDHIVSLSRGGSNTDGNMQLLTPTCNNQKHTKDPIDFMQSRGFLI